MQTVTIISGRKAQSEPRVISPGVYQGRAYQMIEEGVDYFLVKVKGRSVMIDKFLVDFDNEDDEE